MILITDSGSTKCDWVLLNNLGEVIFKTTTLGMNPTLVSKEELTLRISENDALQNVFTGVTRIDFYGAGCGTQSPRNILCEVLTKLFPIAKINVSEDLAAAVYAVTSEAGIVCIIGTGSNSCYFDGKDIHAPIPALGYILMDEASGNYYGKKLLRDYYYNRMPTEIALEFSEKYEVQPDILKMNLYTKSNPNAYLASFAQFIFNQDQIDPYFHKLIKEGVSNFIECRILNFENAHQVPIHFVGSIAYFSKEIIIECFKEHNLKLGNIVQRPIDGLIDYYKGKI